MWAIYRKEINIFFSSLIAYIVIGVFLAANSIFIWVLPDTNVLDFGYATLDQLFNVSPWIFMFLIPAITMRFFAEEKRSGTMEILATRPVSELEILSGKYLAALTLVLFSLIPTLVYFYTVYTLAEPAGNMDVGATWASYLGLLFLGSAYVALGIFASALTDNQIVSFIASAFLCFLFYALIGWMRDYAFLNPVDPVLEAISIQAHYESISKGVLDSRDLIFFLSFTGIFLAITKIILERRKW